MAPVSSFLMVIVTPGRTPPVASDAVPEMVPLAPWAEAMSRHESSGQEQNE